MEYQNYKELEQRYLAQEGGCGFNLHQDGGADNNFEVRMTIKQYDDFITKLKKYCTAKNLSASDIYDSLTKIFADLGDLRSEAVNLNTTIPISSISEFNADVCRKIHDQIVPFLEKEKKLQNAMMASLENSGKRVNLKNLMKHALRRPEFINKVPLTKDIDINYINALINDYGQTANLFAKYWENEANAGKNLISMLQTSNVATAMTGVVRTKKGHTCNTQCVELKGKYYCNTDPYKSGLFGTIKKTDECIINKTISADKR